MAIYLIVAFTLSTRCCVDTLVHVEVLEVMLKAEAREERSKAVDNPIQRVTLTVCE